MYKIYCPQCEYRDYALSRDEAEQARDEHRATPVPPGRQPLSIQAKLDAADRMKELDREDDIEWDEEF